MPFYRCGMNEIFEYVPVNEEYIYNGQAQQFTIPQKGYYKIILAGGSHLGYYQEFYTGTNTGATRYTDTSKGGVVSAAYYLNKNDVVNIALGNCHAKSQASIRCDNYTGSVSNLPDAAAQNSVLTINNQKCMEAAGGRLSISSASTKLVTDGTAGSSSSSPRYVCTGFSGVSYSGGGGSCVENETYRAYQVTVTNHGNELSSGLGSCRIVYLGRKLVNDV